MKIDFPAILEAVSAAGHGDDVEWAENLEPPQNADDFALEVIFVICNSGMHNRVARAIFNRIQDAFDAGKSALEGLGHRGKATAIDWIWKNRVDLLEKYRAADDKLAFLETIPWIGQITKYHAAKNFGLQYAKPDVHLDRLARALSTTPQALCEELAAKHGWKVATVDTVLWRAAALGLLDTSTGRLR